MQRYTVHFSGQVQGVGFRYTTSNIARRFEVAGYVQNLPDGRVRLVAEGEPAEIDRFLAAIDDSIGRYIREKTLDKSAPNGEYGQPGEPDTFGVRY